MVATAAAAARDFHRQSGKLQFASHLKAASRSKRRKEEGSKVDSVGTFTHDGREADRQRDRQTDLSGFSFTKEGRKERRRHGRLIDASFCKLHAVAVVVVGEREREREREIGWLPAPRAAPRRAAAMHVYVCRYDGHPFSPRAFYLRETRSEIPTWTLEVRKTNE